MIRYSEPNNKEILNVHDHTKFRCFEYESERNDNCQCGAVVFKPSDKEIGVVIQTFKEGDFRTDMFGMADASEVRFASRDEVKKYRPELMAEIWGW